MLNRTLPYYLEDRTGLHTASDYDDIYDRLFLRVTCSAPAPQQVARTPSSSSANSMLSSSPPSSSPLAAPPPPFTIAISNTGRRSSTRSYLTGQAPSARGQPPPSVVLDLHGKASRAPMAQWLRKTGMFAGSLSRKFVASSGHELRWIHRGYSGHEWTLVTTPPPSHGAPLSASCPPPSSPLSSSPSSFLSSAPEHVVVASYTLKPPEKSAYNTSGNVLMIGEAWGATLGPEILASLIVMRHIEAHGL
ncbi:hypothetical protein PHLGIDRAFT_13144 [Phlebiopsis gigantea 11061_1 CR5-6]|uniref:Uncharacterized protein n=1 Tax=Phlebiopsis gigantea (strain 11061_1 CR5-6) TaxID=745531 RepID=A0A0C3RZ30_PHLG1|nr:hypothetical protein PHLGIDRAFT_13144 [Phlebiopsis gigantea 11061_1 CR5-6]